MDVLRFTLKGKLAFFKKPDLNSYLYFTYGNIHRVALLGIFGAILGYSGYNSMSFNEKYHKQFKEKISKTSRVYPEFYERLEHLNIAIVPYTPSFDKKMQTFNNSVGYASQEQGGNLVIREQWLENPSWDIYVAIDSDESEKLKNAILNQQYVYNPYLGKNDHPATICNMQLLSDVTESSNLEFIHSLYEKGDFSTVIKEDLDFMEYDLGDSQECSRFKYEERLPVALQEQTNGYIFKDFILTNYNISRNAEKTVYNVEGKNIVFI